MFRIKEILKDKKITITSLAEIVGTDQPHISNIISGRVNPSVDLLQKIADALEIHISELFEKDEMLGIIKSRGEFQQVYSVLDIETLIKKREVDNIEANMLASLFIDKLNTTYILEDKIISFDAIATNNELEGIIYLIRRELGNKRFDNLKEVDAFYKTAILIFNNLGESYWKTVKKGGIIGDPYFKTKMDVDIDNKVSVINQLFKLWNNVRTVNVEYDFRGLEVVLDRNLNSLGKDVIQTAIKILHPFIIRAAQELHKKEKEA